MNLSFALLCCEQIIMVSVIIINYNTFHITCACIESVIRHTKGVEYEIVVVDNASPKDNPDEFKRRFPPIVLVKSAENGGFAKGNNLGIRASKGDIILLLNSDTVLNEDSISKAASNLHSLERVGPLTVRLVYPDGKLQHTARRFRSVGNELLDLARPLLKLVPYKKRSERMLNQYFHGDRDTWCDWVSGAFMMFRRRLLDEMPGGILDERYFMYGEDQLWCYQFRQMGYVSYYYSGTTVIHIHAASTESSMQLKLLKKFIDLELDLMRYRKGESLYYYLFAIIFTLKERARYYIKTVVAGVFNYKMR